MAFTGIRSPRLLLPDTVGTGGDSHPRFPIGISLPAGSGLVAFGAATGIALLPAFVEASIPELQPLTASIEELVTPLWLVTHPKLKDVARIRDLMRAFGPALANAAIPFRAEPPNPVAGLQATR